MSPSIFIAGFSVLFLLILYNFGGLSWFGQLPGDINHRGANTSIHIPLTSMLITSLVVSFLANILFKFF